ncbi:TfoX/Sxy family DNA transformation protein [Cohnella caldifontis]|uniref:TfoX/Sxy family DNA transformation protein n=1 Tax=Cohnella caldifontis TaxID=3027471 RepID=UPI003BB72B93
MWPNPLRMRDKEENIGSVEAYCRLKERFPNKIKLNALYALEAGLWNIHWLESAPEIKDQLKLEAARRADALPSRTNPATAANCASATPSSVT